MNTLRHHEYDKWTPHDIETWSRVDGMTLADARVDSSFEPDADMFNGSGWQEGRGEYSKNDHKLIIHRKSTMNSKLALLPSPKLLPFSPALYRDLLATLIRRSALQAYALGVGGWRRMSVRDRDLAGKFLRGEMEHLSGFANEIAAGELSETMITARTKMYLEHVLAPFYIARRDTKEKLGYTEERRNLSPRDPEYPKHCDSCIAYAAREWVPIGTLPAPTLGSECLTNCECVMEFR